ncbi:DUF6512 family protein [Lachnospiraceae bacterium 38-10]
MKKIKRYTMIGILFVLLMGTLSHFVYDWTGNHAVIGLFTPVNESIWEHMKLLFFPMLLYAFFAVLRLKEDRPCIISSLCLGILTGTLLIPVLFYAYTGILGKDFFILDIGIFIVSTLTAFLLFYRLTLSCKAKPVTVMLCILVCILFVCFLIFTYHPPDLDLFANPPAEIYKAYMLQNSVNLALFSLKP